MNEKTEKHKSLDVGKQNTVTWLALKKFAEAFWMQHSSLEAGVCMADDKCYI